MALPDGVAKVHVQIGPVTDFTGAAFDGAEVSFRPTKRIIWAATGAPLWPAPITVILDSDGLGSTELPATDQDGFIVAPGQAIKDFGYVVTWTFRDRRITPPEPYLIQLPAAAETIDLDLTIVDNSDGDSDGSGTIVLTPMISIGTVTTLPAGSEAYVRLAADQDGRAFQTLDFGIPGGGPGGGDVTELVADADHLAALPAAVVNARSVDIPVDYTRDAPGGSWKRKDGTLVVPQFLSDPTDPGKLARALKDFADASARYARTRTHYDPTLTSAGVPQLMRGFGPELYFTPDQEWHLGGVQDMFNLGLRQKTPAVMLTPALQRLHGDRTTFIWHNTSDANQGFATRYRPYSDAPIRADGSMAPWSTSSADKNGYMAGGRGAGATIEWRYAATAQAVITQDVACGTSSVTVDNVDGIDRAWFAAKGLAVPASLTATALRVGSLAYVAMGQNPTDAHERRDFAICHVVAINGNSTPGFTAQGTGTITLSQPFTADLPIAKQFWSYPSRIGNTYRYLPTSEGGTDNVECHAIFSVDPALYCAAPHIGDFDFLLASATEAPPTSWVSFQSCDNPTTAHLRAFGIGNQIVNFNSVKRGRAGRLEMMGLNPGASLNANAGMVFDACTAEVRVDSMVTRNYIGPVHQSESFSKVNIGDAFLFDAHPARIAGTSSGQTKAAYLIIGESKTHIDNLDWTTVSAQRLAFYTDPAQFSVLHRARINASNSAARPTINANDFAATCRVEYDGWKIDGSARASYKLMQRRRELPIAALYKRGVTVDELLPPGMIGGGEITLPADVAGLTDLRLVNPSMSGGFASVSLLGTTLTDVTGSAIDNVGDGVGTTDDRTIHSANGLLAASEGDAFVWPNGNADGSAFVAYVLNVDSAPNSVVLDTLLPRALTAGSPVRIGDTAIAGKTVKLPRVAFGFVIKGLGGQNFNLGKLEAENAGNRCYLRAIFDNSADDTSGKAVLLDLDVHPQSLPLAAVAPVTRARPVIMGDRKGSTALASLLTALRGQVQDQTVDTGSAGASAPSTVFPAITLSPLASGSTQQTFATSDTFAAGTLATGSLFVVRFHLNVDTSAASGGTMNMRFYVNGVQLPSTAALAISTTAAQAAVPLVADLQLFVEATGAGGSVSLDGIVKSITAASGTVSDRVIQTSVPVDLSSGLTFSSTLTVPAVAGNAVRFIRGSIVKQR